MVACVLVLAVACSSTVRTPSNASLSGSPPTTVVLVVMENSSYADVVGNQAMPFLNDTIAPGSLSLTSMHADAHPSLPNYVWMTAGDACGASNDRDWDRTCPNLYDQLTQRGIAWTTYAEGYPGDGTSCSLTPLDGSTHYARKHVPSLLFSSTSQDAPCRAHVRRFPGAPAADGAPIASFGGITPEPFTVVIPNLCHDLHDAAANCGTAGGGPAGADGWLRLNWEDLVAGAGSRGVVILTWDESDGGDPPIPTFIAGAGITSGQDSAQYDHASTLRAIEDAFGLPCLAGACDAAPLPIGIWPHG